MIASMKTTLVRSVFMLLAAALVGCAQSPPSPPATQALLNDHLFKSDVVASRDDVFAMNDAMRAYARSDVAGVTSLRDDPRRNLLDALYTRNRLRLRYDAGSTRNATEAFEARAGNCLSLVIMTASFAKHLGLPVSYQSVHVDETYTRTAGLLLASGHVNLVLERVPPRSGATQAGNLGLVVDFLPERDLRGERVAPLQEHTIVAMYFNNRAAEALADNLVADAYAWARAAVREDPAFQPATNTLAVIYMRGGHAAEAEATLRHVLRVDSSNTAALTNLRTLLDRQGRSAEAAQVAERLLALQPHPPFFFFDQGRLAMSAGDYVRARDLFAQELRRQPHQHEVHFWAAQAQWQLGNRVRATEHLRQAMENSLTPASQDLYAGKLERLRALRLQ